MTAGQKVTLPLLPLPKGLVLFPGLVRRISVTPNRPDITALLARVYEHVAANSTAKDKDTVNPELASVPIACFPPASPYIGPKGQLMLKEGENVDEEDRPDIRVAQLTKDDLFSWGVAAKITGVEGRGTTSFVLVVEGVTRLRLDKLFRGRPSMLDAKVTFFQDEINLTDLALDSLFQQLKLMSREFVAILRLAAFLPRPGSAKSLSPLFAKRLDYFIVRKKITEAGRLADFMANIIESSYEDKLQVLSLVDVKERISRVLELLERQINNVKGNFKLTTIATVSVPQDPTPSRDREGPKPPPTTNAPPRVTVTFPFPPGPQGLMRRGRLGGDDDDNELEGLKKRLEAAKLPPDGQKVVERELKHLSKMFPAQPEYAVTRNYLETLAEIPWSVRTDDNLGPQTLTLARKQLDDDHYGLQNVKKRLLEYLAVLRLKQSVNDDLDRQIEQAEQEISAATEARKASEESDQDAAGATDGGDDDTSPADPPPARRAAYLSSTPDVHQDAVAAAAAKLSFLKSKRISDKSPILLLVGPPGVGKTSLARSVATALGRKFHRISLGGVRDEAEIRGHRRTYVAAMPGVLVQGLKKVGVSNPVFLLDEIDKVGKSNFHGDPSAAMLEVLDPEQNHTFMDHYVNISIDLSRVLFIATANSLDTIPAPLLDRMETLHIPGYTPLEKRHIATQHLIPKQLRVNGLGDRQVVFPPDAVSKIIESYTRESGVRNLEREIGSVCRSKAVEFADATDRGHPETFRGELTVDDLEGILGIAKYEAEIAETTSRPGIVTGLVAFSSGMTGSILFIEMAAMPGPAGGSITLTGKLGDVLKESVEVALSWVKSHAHQLGLVTNASDNVMHNRSVHVHCPSGSIPKDGPSSGIAQVVALISLFSGKGVPPRMAMTGEISLRGRVTAVGGIREKLIGALRAGIKTVLLPAQNRKEVKDLPVEVKHGLEIIHVSHVWEALRHVWPGSPWESVLTGMDSQL